MDGVDDMKANAVAATRENRTHCVRNSSLFSYMFLFSNTRVVHNKHKFAVYADIMPHIFDDMLHIQHQQKVKSERER